MSRIQVFNHHSLPYDDQSQAERAVPDFLKLCLVAKRLGFDVILLDETQDSSWFRIELAPGYFFQDWYKNVGRQGVYREELRAFQAVVTKTPLFAAEDIDKGLALFEVREATSQIDYSTLRAAAWFDAPISSFSTRAPWDQNPVAVVVSTLDEDGEHQTSRDITNWHSLSVIAEMEESLRKERDAAIRSGGDMWEKKAQFFPLLTFCGETVSQIQTGLYTQTVLNQVRESLHFLNRFAEKWQSGEIVQYTHEALRKLGMPHQVSGEKETVRKDPRLRNAREFWLESGEKVFFENHIKLSAGFRIHFYPDPAKRCIHVGYIGRHLPTARYR